MNIFENIKITRVDNDPTTGKPRYGLKLVQAGLPDEEYSFFITDETEGLHNCLEVALYMIKKANKKAAQTP